MYLTWGTSREKLAQRGKCREKTRRAFRFREVRIRVKRQLRGRVGPTRLCRKPTSLNRGWFEISERRVFRVGRNARGGVVGGKKKERERRGKDERRTGEMWCTEEACACRITCATQRLNSEFSLLRSCLATPRLTSSILFPGNHAHPFPTSNPSLFYSKWKIRHANSF